MYSGVKPFRALYIKRHCCISVFSELVPIFPECGDGKCEEVEGEDCEKCPADCGNCPLKPWQLALIGLSAALVVGGIVAVFIVSTSYLYC